MTTLNGAFETHPEPGPQVSVVINYYNESENSDMAPRCLASQKFRDFEVILVDDGSTDGSTKKIVQKYGSEWPAYRIIRNERPAGLRPSRNLGVRSAGGSIVVTLDLHTLFDELFLERVVKIFHSSQGIAAVGALVLPLGNTWYIRGVRVLERMFVELRFGFRGYGYVFGTAAAYSRESLHSLGLLSENEVVEDTDFSWRATDASLKVVILRDNVVYHKEKERFRFFVTKLLRGGLRASFVAHKHKLKLLYPQFLLRLLSIPVVVVCVLLFPLESVLLLASIGLAYLALARRARYGTGPELLYSLLVLVLFLFFTWIGILSGFIYLVTRPLLSLQPPKVDLAT